MTRHNGGEPTIRRAVEADTHALADLLWTVRAESVPAIPALAHPRESVEPFVSDVLLAQFEVWVAELQGRPVGFIAVMAPDQLGHLYIAADHRDRGLGSRLVALAQDRFPEGLELWTFQANDRARRFYRRNGFVDAEHTEGDPEEGAPDVRMVWRPSSDLDS